MIGGGKSHNSQQMVFRGKIFPIKCPNSEQINFSPVIFPKIMRFHRHWGCSHPQ